MANIRPERRDSSPFVEYLTDEGLSVESLDEMHPLIIHLTSNYIIMRSILSHLGWRQLANCAQVCRLWRDIVKSLQRENLHSYDFVVEKRLQPTLKVLTKLSEEPLLARPLFAIAFYNVAAHDSQFNCRDYVVAPCEPPCNKEHFMLMAMEATLMSKDSYLLGVMGSRLIYMPAPHAETAAFTLRDRRLSVPFLAGLYIPKIPNVMFHALQYRTRQTVREDIFDTVDEICRKEIIKGIIVFVEDHFMLMHDDDLDFLNYFKSKQPDVPFALGGCMVEQATRTALDGPDTNVTLAVVTVPREPDASARSEFHMYSHVIDRTVFRKPAVQKSIEMFSKSIPEMEYSAALKLSCVGREHLHNVEQDRFRACFPRTTVIGCYGNGELGYNVPPPPGDASSPPPASKRRRQPDSDAEPDFSYSYSTVFVYFGWGKMLRPANAE